MDKRNEANGTASEPIARYDEHSILRTYKVAFDNIVKIGGFWAVGPDKLLYHIEMPDKVKECMWKDAKRYDIQTGKVMGYTNADRIRSLSDEELAEFMCHNVSNGTVNCAFCAAAEFCRMGHNGWLDWLREEAGE